MNLSLFRGDPDRERGALVSLLFYLLAFDLFTFVFKPDGLFFYHYHKRTKRARLQFLATHCGSKSKQNNIYSYLAHGILFLTSFSPMGPTVELNANWCAD